MATAEQFRAAAHGLRGAADSASDAEFRVRTASYGVGVVGCELEELVHRAMTASQVMAGELRASILLAEADVLARAATCDEFAADYAHWQSSRARWHELGPPPPSPPPRPTSWADLP